MIHAVNRLAVVLVLALSHAAIADEDDGRRLLDEFLTGVETLSARFDQSLIDADGVVVDESSGMLHIMRPGRFRWAYELPYEQLMVADGLNVWSYDVDLAQVTVNSQSEVLGSTPALLLGGTDNIFDDFDFVESTEDRETTWVILSPKSTDNGFTKVELGFNDDQLRRMIFSDNLQQSTLIVLYDLTVNEEIAEDLFTFSPPAGADLVGTPIVASDP